MKHIGFSLLFLLSLTAIMAQAAPDSTQNGFGMVGGLGSVTIGGQSYTEFRLLPELAFGKFGVGLDVDLLIDSDGNVRQEDWDQLEDYINKIYYVRYGTRNDPVYGRVGGFPSYTLAHGLLMSDYTNMLRYPNERQVGVQFGFNLPFYGLGVEAFTSNVVDNDIIAARVKMIPLQGSGIPLLDNLSIAASAVTDRNQYDGLLDTDNDDYPDVFDLYPNDKHKWNDYAYWQGVYQEINGSTVGFDNWYDTSTYTEDSRNAKKFSDLGKEDVTGVSIDYDLPLIQTTLFTLSHYGEAAKILDHKMGFIFPGFYSKFLIFNLNLEGRYYQEDFTPAFFDHLYDENRAMVVGDSVYLKSDQIKASPEQKGWYGSLTTNLFNFLFVRGSYEDMYASGDDKAGKSVWGAIWIDQKLIPMLTTARVDYSQTNEEHPLKHWRTVNSYVTGKLGYAMSSTTELYGRYQEHYVDENGDGKIKGADEIVKTMTFGVEFHF